MKKLLPTRARQVAERMIAATRVFCLQVFGRWEPPPWLRWLARRAASSMTWARAHRAVSVGIVLLLVAAGTGGFFGWKWYQNRPKPIVTELSLTAPPAMEIADKAVPNPLLIEFAGSVAPLSAIDKPVTSGVALSPAIAGKWKWVSDKLLSFTPDSDWPVGQPYTVELEKSGLVAKHITLARYELEFSSAPFAVEMTQAEFYQDPVDPNLKKVVATFKFSHQVDQKSFEKQLRMHFLPGNKEERAFDPAVEVSYDRKIGLAHVHSTAFPIPEKDAEMKIVLAKGVQAERGGPAFDKELTQSVRVPGLYNYFQVSGVELQIVDNARMEPERVLIVNLSTGTTEKEMAKSVQAYLLPVTNPDEPDAQVAGDAARPYAFGDPDRISPAILKAGAKLELEQLAAEKEYSDTQSFRLKADAGRYIYVEVKKGAVAFGGYILGETSTYVLQVNAFPRQLKFMSSGALLALGGQRRITLMARDAPGVRFDIARVLPDQIHHLVALSEGKFAQPEFIGGIGPDNLADALVETRALTVRPGKPVYEALDLSRYLEDGRRGLFLVRAETWDPASEQTLGDGSVSRLVLVTDLGLLAKTWNDGQQDLFVQNVRTGAPVAGARVEVIGKNGLPLFAETTDASGRAHFPTFESLRAEKEPVLYLATLGRDSAFLPIGDSDRTLDASRFDIGGVGEGSEPQSLSAYVFSDRGVYRPGDEIRAGLIVKPKDWSQSVDRLPLIASVVDARGLEVKREKVVLGAEGVVELRHQTPAVAPTGTYTISVHTVKDGQPDSLLGSATVQVREFLPDRMAIKVALSDQRSQGWVAPADLKGRVTLTNLFGIPAAGRRVTASLQLVPGLPSFGELRDYTFFDPAEPRTAVTEELPATATDDAGHAEIPLGLERYADATYRLSLVAEGFEAGGGRGVTAEASVVVSALPYLIGWKADGDLDYISRGAPRSIELIALAPTGARTAVPDLTAVLVRRQFVSVLMRQDNGTYKYESVKKEIEVERKPLAIAADGTRWKVPAGTPGDFVLSIRTATNKEVQRARFSVAGAGDISRSMEKNAELELSLKSKDVEAGGTIEVQIRAPYTGAGLITVERDRVYAVKWFKADTTATVETIDLPADLEGGGYVGVTFIRDPASEEVFASPLSYGVVPFSVSRARRAVELTVTAPELVKPGQTLTLNVRARQKARAVVFAVDEGILRVSRYQSPDPLGFFFEKRALSVSTSQILDLILPEHQRLLMALAPGGDDGAAELGANLNPFKRRRDPPVVYWSGLIDVGPKGQELKYEVPDYFNGTLRIMAVAVAPEAVGAFETKSLVRGDFVISPNVPPFVAPDDVFEMPVTVSNNVVGSGAGKVTIKLVLSPHLEVVGESSVSLAIAEMREGTALFKLKAKHLLGSASIGIEARLGDKHGELSSDLSVRPAAPFLTTVTAGYVKEGQTSVPVARKLYAEYRELTAAIAPVPLALASGLSAYLKSFPHGCTEQVVSQAVPAVALGKQGDFGYTPATAQGQVSALIDILRTRQNDEGAFGLWAANPRVVPAVTVYAMHILTDAREHGYAVPGDVMKKGLAYLQTLARRTPDDLDDARSRTHAIYVLTRNEINTSAFIAAAEKNLAANHEKVWKEDLAGAYLAASKRILKQDAVAERMVAAVRIKQAASAVPTDYSDPLSHAGQFLYLLSRHFPELAQKLDKGAIEALVEPIARGDFNTYSAAFAILGLEAYARLVATASQAKLSIVESGGKGKTALALSAGLVASGSFSADASALAFGSDGDFGVYYALSQQGFDRALPTQPMSTRLEVFREFVDKEGKPVKEVALGAEVRVRLRMRALGEPVSNVAVVDLLPGGFEVVIQQSAAGAEAGEAGEGGEGSEGEMGDVGEGEGGEGDPAESYGGPTLALPIALDGTSFAPDFGDVREDRVVLYGTLDKDVVTFEYSIKATNVGQYVVAPLQAEGLYDRSAQARSAAGSITVKAP